MNDDAPMSKTAAWLIVIATLATGVGLLVAVVEFVCWVARHVSWV